MPFSDEDPAAMIESLIGKATSVATRWNMPEVLVAHFLYAFVRDHDGKLFIENRGGNPSRLLIFLEQTFHQHVTKGISRGGVKYSHQLNVLVQRVLARMEEEGEWDLDILLEEMKTAGAECKLANQALIVAGIVWAVPSTGAAPDMFEQNPAQGEFDTDSTQQDGDEELYPVRETEETAPNEDDFTKAARQSIRDLTALAKANRLDDVIGMDEMLDQVVETLLKRRKPNLLIHGEPGVGKTALAEALAQRVASGEVPEALRARPVLEVQLSELVAGTRFRGDFEARMRALVGIAKKANAILFIDEIHLLMGAGATGASNGMDAANILKPALARGEITLIGATTPSEMRVLRKDAALMRRFDALAMAEPTAAKTRQIVDQAIADYMIHHDVDMGDDMLDLTVSLCEKYLPAQRFPDKAFNTIDRACVLAKQRGSKLVDISDVRGAIERQGGVRLGKPDAALKSRLAALEDALEARVFGQSEAVKAMARQAKAAVFGISHSGAAGAYLFNGPSGTGKTEMAYAFAEAMGYPLVRIDMSEFMERHSVAGLIGAPPGYVGYNDDGLLVEAADKHADMVLLFDEAEKAHPEIFDLLLQILDHGVLRAADGRILSFARTHVILSANIGAREGERQALGFGRETDAQSEATEAVARTFRNELLARIPNRVQFTKASDDDRCRIIAKELEKSRQKLRDRGYEVTFAPEVATWVAKRPETGIGARGLQDGILEWVQQPLMEFFLEEEQHDRAHVEIKEDRLIIQ